MTDEIKDIAVAEEVNPYVAPSYVEALEELKPKRVRTIVANEPLSPLAVELKGKTERHKELLEQLTLHGALVGNPNHPHTLNAIKVIAMRFGLEWRILLDLIIRFNKQ